MHYRMLVTVTAEPSEASVQARHRVYDLLMQDPSFCGEGGRFGSPAADWFVIGGRWSGCLAETLMGDAYRQRLKASFPALAGEWCRGDDVKEHADALDALWRECGGTGRLRSTDPATRSMGTTTTPCFSPETSTALLAEYAGETSSRDGWHSQFIDLDDEPLHEGFAGRKWLVVVDYHN